MPVVNFGSFSKKRNSTKQPTTELSDSRNVKLKDFTSADAPTFILTGNEFNYNYAEWDSRYYLITDIRSLHNNLIEVDCILDVLATYKSYILASTQYVCYSSSLSSVWLEDSRVPSLSKSNSISEGANFNIFSKTGTYILSVNGENGCVLYLMTETKLKQLLQNVSTWRSTAESEFLNGLTAPGSDIVVATENLYTVIARSGAFGNAYSEAPNCIRSCIWIPFKPSIFTVTDANKEIYLGQFPTGVYADAISSEPYSNYSNITIPWHYSDWRRVTNESLSLYLPLVGTVSLNSENIVNQIAIMVRYSVTPTDGCIAYEILAGSNVIGTYGASCAANYPIGISQQASAGDIINSVLSGAEKTINSAVNSSISPLSMTAAGAQAAFQTLVTAYDITKTTYSNNNTCIGGIGGGAGSGLDLVALLTNIYRETVIEPSAMLHTMGVPTMKPTALSSLSGFCQCANAHVDAPAMAYELDAIDSYLNSGFFIE